MLAKHVGEEQIQDYLDGNLSASAQSQFERHVHVCDDCKTAVSDFRDMYINLQVEPDIMLPKNFSRQVLRRTHKKQMGAVQFGLQQLFFALAFLIVGINVSLYYLETDAAAAGVKESFSSLFQFLPGMTAIFSDLLKQVKIPGANIILVLAVLIVLYMVDKLVLQPRFRHAS